MAGPSTGFPADAGRHLAELKGLEGHDVLEAVDHAAADLHEAGAFAGESPAFKRAGRHPPAVGELGLGKVGIGHCFSPWCD